MKFRLRSTRIIDLRCALLILSLADDDDDDDDLLASVDRGTLHRPQGNNGIKSQLSSAKQREREKKNSNEIK